MNWQTQEMKKKKNIYIYIYTTVYTMCPPGYHHNGFMATPELGHIYNFTEVQVSRVIIVLLLQNCFVWCKHHTHQAILTTELLGLEG